MLRPKAMSKLECALNWATLLTAFPRLQHQTTPVQRAIHLCIQNIWMLPDEKPFSSFQAIQEPLKGKRNHTAELLRRLDKGNPLFIASDNGRHALKSWQVLLAEGWDCNLLGDVANNPDNVLAMAIMRGGAKWQAEASQGEGSRERAEETLRKKGKGKTGEEERGEGRHAREPPWRKVVLVPGADIPPPYLAPPYSPSKLKSSRRPKEPEKRPSQHHLLPIGAPKAKVPDIGESHGKGQEEDIKVEKSAGTQEKGQKGRRKKEGEEQSVAKEEIDNKQETQGEVPRPDVKDEAGSSSGEIHTPTERPEEDETSETEEADEVDFEGRTWFLSGFLVRRNEQEEPIKIDADNFPSQAIEAIADILHPRMEEFVCPQKKEKMWVRWSEGRFRGPEERIGQKGGQEGREDWPEGRPGGDAERNWDFTFEAPNWWVSEKDAEGPCNAAWCG